MHARLKIMTVFVTMTAMFAMLPALSAVAAEPLDDGGYTVVAGDESLALQVTEGTPLVADTPGVEWFFDYDDEGRVLDEFDVVVDGVAYEVEVGEDGTAFVTPHDDDFVPTTPAPDVTLAVEAPELDEGEGEESEEKELEEDEGEDAAHGELVSAVARCAPNGRTAREAGMPNHGAFVSAMAKGEVLTVTVGETDFVIDPSAGADAVCATIADALAAGEAEAAAKAAAEADSDTDDAPRGNGKDKDRDGAPGKSGEAPGKAKKGTQD